MYSFTLNKIERQRLQIKEWRRGHPEKLKEYTQRRAERDRKRYHTDPEFRKREQEISRRSNNKRYGELREAVVQKLGGKCVYCGCDVYEALEINHINGGGSKELSKRGLGKGRLAFYKEILNNQREDIELVCRVCNSVHWLKFKGIIGHKVIWSINT